MDLTWASAQTLGGQDFESVAVGLEPEDGLRDGVGVAVFSEPFALDNNQAPLATLNGTSFVLNPDLRRGIPIPFTMTDQDNERGDLLAVFQWSTDPSSFPALPERREEIDAILADPAKCDELAIASEWPVFVEGRVLQRTTTERLRLPELASSAATILAGDLAGRDLELLRASRVPVALSHAWELDEPLAALPVGDGREVLVFDRNSAATWRLRKFELVSGRLLQTLVEGERGRLSSVAVEPGVRSALVAAHQRYETRFADRRTAYRRHPQPVRCAETSRLDQLRGTQDPVPLRKTWYPVNDSAKAEAQDVCSHERLSATRSRPQTRCGEAGGWSPRKRKPSSATASVSPSSPPVVDVGRLQAARGAAVCEEKVERAECVAQLELAVGVAIGADEKLGRDCLGGGGGDEERQSETCDPASTGVTRTRKGEVGAVALLGEKTHGLSRSQ